MSSLFGGTYAAPKPVKHKIFVSYHHGGDQGYYDAFSKHFHDTYETIYDNSLDRVVDSENVDYVMRRISDNFITGSSCTLVFIGAQTPYRKYVDWEIKATLDKCHGLIGVHLPSAIKSPTGNIIVPNRLHDNVVSGYALFVSWADITSSSQRLHDLIAVAKVQPSSKIDNSRAKRLKNG